MWRPMDELSCYATPSPMTALADDAVLAGLPSDMAGIATTLRGLMMHRVMAPRHGVEITDARRDEEQLRSASAMVARIVELAPAHLVEPRPPERRLVVNCRHFAVLACALLRRAGLPARARVGFATYLEPGRYSDHWVVERWQDGRWVCTDPDAPVEVDFDPLDMPPGRFLTAGEAWRLCRSGAANPEHFGAEVWWGAWMIRNNVLRDLAALNRVELLPWDSWGLMDRSSRLSEGPSDALVDQVAECVAAGSPGALRRLYEGDDRLRAPEALR
jgi:Transglutaminase-like superfamily